MTSTTTMNSQKVVLISGGSFSPITFAHLRMFEMARDHLTSLKFTVLQGILSPVSDFYKKAGLIEAKHRVEMCTLAVSDSDWIICDNWESKQQRYTTTVELLHHGNISQLSYSISGWI